MKRKTTTKGEQENVIRQNPKMVKTEGKQKGCKGRR